MDKELWKAIDYLKEQVRVLQEQQERDKRILLSNHQRIRLAAKAKRLTRRLLEETTVLFTPDTILGWYRKLIAQKYDGSRNCKNPGRPKISQEITDLVIRFKQENPHWGYARIRDYIVYLGYKIGETTVKNILVANGLDPEPDFTRKTTWKEFIKSHWSVLAACDFFSVELLVKGKLIRCMVLFAMDLSTRRVEILGVRPRPNGPWMEQIARNLTWEDGFLAGKRYLIHAAAFDLGLLMRKLTGRGTPKGLRDLLAAALTVLRAVIPRARDLLRTVLPQLVADRPATGAHGRSLSSITSATGC